MIFAEAIAFLTIAGLMLAVAPWLLLAGRGIGLPVVGWTLFVIFAAPGLFVLGLLLLGGLLDGEPLAFVALAALAAIVVASRVRAERTEARHRHDRFRRLRRNLPA